MKKKNLTQNFFSFFAGVVDTTDKNSFPNISAKIFEKIRNGLSGILRGPGALIYEKNLMSKISCQTPFKLFSASESLDSDISAWDEKITNLFYTV